MSLPDPAMKRPVPRAAATPLQTQALFRPPRPLPCSVHGGHREIAMSIMTPSAPSVSTPSSDQVTFRAVAQDPAQGVVRKQAGSHSNRSSEPAQSSGRQQGAGSSGLDEVGMFERALSHARARKARGSSATSGSSSSSSSGSSSSSSSGSAAPEPTSGHAGGPATAPPGLESSSPAAAAPPIQPPPPSPSLPPEEYALLLQAASALVRSSAPAAPPSSPHPLASSSPTPQPPPPSPPPPTQCPDIPLTYETSTFTIRLMDGITPATLPDLPPSRYQFCGPAPTPPSPSSASAPFCPDPADPAPAAILLRNHQLTVAEVPPSVCCIARCGPGAFTNVPIARMTELGIPVFNTPGANSNAVKELVVCALVMASRGVLEAAAHVSRVYEEEQMVHTRIVRRFDAARRQFKGSELEGKTLGVVGLGAVGSRVVGAALALGMEVVGFDPWISAEATWKLPGDRMTRAEVLEDLLMDSDYITVHVPYFNRATHHLLNASNLHLCKPGVHIINFSPSQIIDGAAVRRMYDAGALTGRYIADFSDPDLMGHPRHLVLPHLGACTREAEDKSAAMAGASVQEFLETGNVRQSVNFPPVVLKKKPFHEGPRLCIVVQNEPGVLGHIATFLGSRGVNIEQEVTGSRGSLAYMMLDIGLVDDPADLQAQLARECPGIISSRFISDPHAGGPLTFFNINTSTWPTLDSFDLDENASCSSIRWSLDIGSREEDDDEDEHTEGLDEGNRAPAGSR